MEAKAGEMCAIWNNSSEAETLGVVFGYTTTPIMEISVHPRNAPISTRMFRAHLEMTEVHHAEDQ